MTVLYIGGEPGDFTPVNNTRSLSQDAATYRPTTARCSMIHTHGETFITPMSVGFGYNTNLWLGVRVAHNPALVTAGTWTGNLVTFYSDGLPALYVRAATTGGGVRTLAIVRHDGTAEQVVATGTREVSLGLSQIAVRVGYQTGGQVTVYQEGAPVVSYTGNVVRSGTTSLNSLLLTGANTAAGSQSFWSEIIVTNSEDVRRMSLRTLVPSQLGSVAQWTGTAAGVAETVPSATGVLTSTTAGQQVALKPATVAAVPASEILRAVRVSASANKSASSTLSYLKLGVRQGTTSAYWATVIVSTSYVTQSALLQYNLATGLNWATADLAQLALAFETSSTGT